MSSTRIAPLLVVLAALVACSPEAASNTSAYGSGGGGEAGGSSEGGAGGSGDGASSPTSTTGSSTASNSVASSSASTTSGAGGEGAGGEGAGGEGGGVIENPCPGGFACTDGDCIPFAFFCDGADDCADGQDEDIDACAAFIDGTGICDSQLAFTGNPGLNLCAGAACCGDFNACTDNGSDVPSCVECFEDGGGALCDDALACVEEECPGGGSGICDSTLTTNDLDRDYCLSTECCEEHQACIGSGSEDDIEACLACFDSEEGGELCDEAIACGEASCPFVTPAGVCDSGLTTNDAQDDECLSDACCDEFSACTADGTDVEACIDCIDLGGGGLCDDALDCAAAECP
jgi:hypothetical protein